jgi:hypothetical protein
MPFIDWLDKILTYFSSRYIRTISDASRNEKLVDAFVHSYCISMFKNISVLVIV